MATDDDTSATRPAAEIPVTLFREILMLPLALVAPTNPGRRAQPQSDGSDDPTVRLVDEAVERLEGPASPWLREPDLLRHLSNEADNSEAVDAYEEFVYYPSYLQRLLYGLQKDRGGAARGTHPPLRLYRRHRPCALDIEAPTGEAGRTVPLRLNVERCNLYLVNTGVLILVVEVAVGLDVGTSPGGEVPHGTGQESRLSLADVMAVHECIRRVFPPFFVKDRAEHFPRALAWVHDRETAPPVPPIEGAAPVTCLATVQQHRATPIVPAWATLLLPLRFEGDREGRDDELRLRQLGDDRAYAMLLVGVEGVDAIRRGDWMRLCFADRPGDGLPYAEAFMAKFEEEHCYDRFWQPGHALYTTRQMMCAYAYAMIGEDGGFFRNPLDKHFRRHYFQLALLAQIERASLLTLSDRLNATVERYGGRRERRGEFRRQVQAVQREIITFTHHFWFVEISQQMQGREMFDMWRRHLRLQALYDQLAREAADASAYLQSEEQGEIGRATDRLNRVVLPGLLVAGVTGFFGMNFFEQDDLANAPIGRFASVAFILTLLFALFYSGYLHPRLPDQLRQYSLELFLASVVLGILSLGFFAL